MVGWHRWLNGHEFEQTPGDGAGQGGLACCRPWGGKESDTTEPLDCSSNRAATWARDGPAQVSELGWEAAAPSHLPEMLMRAHWHPGTRAVCWRPGLNEQGGEGGCWEESPYLPGTVSHLPTCCVGSRSALSAWAREAGVRRGAVVLHSLPCGRHFTFVVSFHFSATTVWSVF